MFDIEYKGGNAVVITTKKTKVMIDPKVSQIGLKDLSVKGAVVLATGPEHLVAADDSLLVIDGPGEYEVSDVSIRAVAADRYGTSKGSREATIYRVEVGDVRIAVLGNIASELSETQLEALGVIDMIILPVGGGDTLNATEATQLVRTIEAKVVIPVHYADSALSYEAPQDTLETFKKEYGGEVEQVGKYKVKAGTALPAAATVIELTRS